MGARLLAQERGNVITEENGSGWRRLLRVAWAISPVKSSELTQWIFFRLNKAYETQNVWTFTPFLLHMMGFNECESTKVQMTLDAFGGG